MAAEDYHDMDQLNDADYAAQFDGPDGKGEVRMAKTKKAGLQRSRRKPAPTPRRKHEFAWVARYYVGSQAIADKIADGENSNWTHSTLASAAADARDKLDDGTMELVTVVKIIKIFRRAKSPIEEVDLP